MKSVLGPLIKAHRLKAGKMQKEYAAQLGVSPAQLQKLEKSLHEPKEGLVLNMIEILGIDIKNEILRLEAEYESRSL